ncbi:hypothetical protein EW146_g8856 [Bondarzewia mesenterica]|uniref:Glycosyltransferase family 8 protein n=1 Tax=Bondarzewia mesenterica TaxID=1095465 RepID=A0A4S4LCU5_9AGAM|nr:hypothetical protein EW146_g8856 [Bondarzewia mesenterica]
MTYQPSQKLKTHTDYLFTPTQDWFSFNIDDWKLLFPLVTSAAPRVLEIGSWEGRSAVFLLTELCKQSGSIVCIDHFDLQRTDAGKERYRKITHNLALTGKPHRILDEFSFPALMQLLEEEMVSEEPGFDWIYIDGSHEADDTALDGELAWRLARRGAIVIFDDYDWDSQPKESMHHPKRGIDAFLALHKGDYTLLSSPTQYQVILKKTSDMRIGFLVKDKADRADRLRGALGYGVYVAYAVDQAYAMPAAVSIRSLILHTPGRVTVYVVDCGLTEDDKEKLQHSIPHRNDFTLLFIDLPKNSLVQEMGIVWAKVDLMRTLPVERVLYVDADTLVRGDVRALWNTDLDNHSLGATRDVGLPMGHDELRCCYFNAGVLLMDLTRIRARASELEALARSMRDSPFRDQDILNVHFRDDVLEISLAWNGQGLGTYAEMASEDRDKVNLQEMTNPRIVHFTGPVQPEMASVLNRWVQPYTAKPWGYAGAPGHPYAEEWWRVLDDTAWKGYRTSEAFRRIREEAMANAEKDAIVEFERKVGSAID